MSLKDEIHRILDSVNNDLDKAAIIVYKRKELELYVIHIGLEHISSRRRANTRRELNRDIISPTFGKGKYGKFPISKRSKEKLIEATRTLFNSWKINASIYLGDATKEDLLATAENERNSAQGHTHRAEFYEKLADPMREGQLVKDYWKDANAVELIRREIFEEDAAE